MTKRMPVVFVGHGSPMMALEDTEITRTIHAVGERIARDFGRPKAILAVSAHWFVPGTFVQSAPEPKQVYDMYGFPQELYQVKYSVKGDASLTHRVEELLGSRVSVNDEWGIDHGTWTVLVHMFPEADIPVVQLSVSRGLSPQESYELGRELTALRDEGVLILGSGNVVHNLMRVQWENPNGTVETESFNDYIRDAVLEGDAEKVANFRSHPNARYAVPTPDHFLPLLYIMGAADGDRAEAFNDTCTMGALAMTGFIFGGNEE